MYTYQESFLSICSMENITRGPVLFLVKLIFFFSPHGTAVSYLLGYSPLKVRNHYSLLLVYDPSVVPCERRCLSSILP